MLDIMLTSQISASFSYSITYSMANILIKKPLHELIPSQRSSKIIIYIYKFLSIILIY